MLERFCLTRPRLTLFLGLLLALAGLAVAVARLRFTTDRTQLLGPHTKVQRDWNRYRAEFGHNLDYVILLKSGSEKSSRAATDLLGSKLSQSGAFEMVLYRLDLPEVARHGLYFLKLDQLRQLHGWLTGAPPWLQLLARHPEPGGLLAEISSLSNRSLVTRLRPVLPLLVKSLEGLAQSLESGGRSRFQSPMGEFQSDAPALAGRAVIPGQTRFYNQLADGRTFMVVALPKDRSGSISADVSALRELHSVAASVRRSFPEVTLMVTGEPAINTEEMLEALGDAKRCTLVALAGTSLLLVIGFGRLSRPLCAVLSLLMGLGWSLGLAALTIGQLNLLTVHFLTLLTGLGINFGIFFLSQFQTERCQGRTAPEAISSCLKEARHQGVGAVTTAVAFFSLQFTSFRAAAELGWITGAGVLLCYVSTLLMLPAMLTLLEGERPCLGHPAYGQWFAPWEQWLRQRPRAVSLVCLLLTLLSGLSLGRIPFDYNLLHMQSPDAEAIRVEAYLQKIGYSTLYAISLAPNAEEARRRTAVLEKLPLVSRVESVLSLEPRNLEAKRPLVEALVKLGPKLQLPPKPVPLSAFSLLETYNSYLMLRPRLLELARQLQEPALVPLMVRLEKVMDPANPGPLAAGLQAYQKDLLLELKRQLSFLREQRAEVPDLLAMVPPELRARSLSPRGTICLRIFPKENCWEREPLGRFVSQLQEVDADLTGTPVLIFSYLELLRSAYSVSGRQAFMVITLLLLLHYRSFKCTLLALTPKLVAVIWMFGGMALLGASFNAANFLALPLTLGIGLLFGMESLRMCQSGTPMATQSAGFAIALSGLTTVVGFSALMEAQHRGVASFGLLMSLGVGLNLLTSLLMLPALTAWSGFRGPKSGPPEPPSGD
jgi:hopanoid biosynthesis associated RND transporter like protein HpnN